MSHPSVIPCITVDDLRKNLEAPDNLTVVDVRQPEEFAIEHVPGAILLPLGEMEHRVDELQPTKRKVFYCRMGSRSRRAARVAANVGGSGDIFSLSGGLAAWRGERVTELPAVRVFDSTEPNEAALRWALDLEKAAVRTHAELLRQQRGGRHSSIIEKLIVGEVAHARILYAQLQEAAKEGLGRFDEFFASLPGEVLDTTDALAEVMRKRESTPRDCSARLLELAIEMEFAAYDLYRAFAAQAKTEASRQTFASLADQEKSHVHSLLGALGDSAGADPKA